jgi:hypothetical protein
VKDSALAHTTAKAKNTPVCFCVSDHHLPVGLRRNRTNIDEANDVESANRQVLERTNNDQ